MKVDFQGSHVTSDGGLILVRELDERLGLGELIDEHLSDSRQGTNKQFTFADLLRQSVYSRLAGYEDLNDAERVSADPTFRLIGSKKLWDRGAALTSRLHSFETELLASEENLLGLMAVNRELLSQAEGSDNSDRVVLDMDSTESPVHGQQEGSAYNGHFESICYHPLLLFNQHGDCLAAKLRPGNVSSAEDWDELLVPEIERQQGAGKRLTFRADAAFAKPEIYEALEDRGVDYVIRIPANKKLEWEIADILFRPPGRPSAKPLVRYKSFRYQAESWSKPRRLVAKVEHHLGELFARLRFIVTNMSLPSRSVVRFYNKRGTAEQWIKEGKQATHWTRLSCHRFRANEVRLQLSVLAYNLGNLWRRLGLPQRIKSWSLTPGFPFWPSWSVYDSRLPAAMERFSHCCQGSVLLSLPLRPSNAGRSWRSSEARGPFSNTSPAPTLGNPRTLAVPGRRRYPPGTGSAQIRRSMSPNNFRLRCPSASSNQ